MNEVFRYPIKSTWWIRKRNHERDSLEIIWIIMWSIHTKIKWKNKYLFTNYAKSTRFLSLNRVGAKDFLKKLKVDSIALIGVILRSRNRTRFHPRIWGCLKIRQAEFQRHLDQNPWLKLTAIRHRFSFETWVSNKSHSLFLGVASHCTREKLRKCGHR